MSFFCVHEKKGWRRRVSAETKSSTAYHVILKTDRFKRALRWLDNVLKLSNIKLVKEPFSDLEKF
jgi:hypothetical protein